MSDSTPEHGYQLSSFATLQVLKALQGLVLFIMFSYHTPDGKNPLWPFIGYPGEFQPPNLASFTISLALLFEKI